MPEDPTPTLNPLKTPIIKLVLLISPIVTTPTSVLTPTLNPTLNPLKTCIIKLVLLISPIVTIPTSILTPTIPIVSTLALAELTLLLYLK